MPDTPSVSSNVLIEQVQAQSAALATEAAQAIDQAAQTAKKIANDIQTPGSPGDATIAEPSAASPSPAAALITLPPELHRLLAIEVPIIVQLGARRLSVGDVMRFCVGSIIEFSKAADEELDLLANNRPIGKGLAVKVGENFGIKISSIIPVKETIRKLGEA